MKPLLSIIALAAFLSLTACDRSSSDDKTPPAREEKVQEKHQAAPESEALNLQKIQDHDHIRSIVNALTYRDFFGENMDEEMGAQFIDTLRKTEDIGDYFSLVDLDGDGKEDLVYSGPMFMAESSFSVLFLRRADNYVRVFKGFGDFSEAFRKNGKLAQFSLMNYGCCGSEAGSEERYTVRHNGAEPEFVHAESIIWEAPREHAKLMRRSPQPFRVGSGKASLFAYPYQSDVFRTAYYNETADDPTQINWEERGFETINRMSDYRAGAAGLALGEIRDDGLVFVEMDDRDMVKDFLPQEDFEEEDKAPVRKRRGWMRSWQTDLPDRP